MYSAVIEYRVQCSVNVKTSLLIMLKSSISLQNFCPLIISFNVRSVVNLLPWLWICLFLLQSLCDCMPMNEKFHF